MKNEKGAEKKWKGSKDGKIQGSREQRVKCERSREQGKCKRLLFFSFMYSKYLEFRNLLRACAGRIVNAKKNLWTL